MNITFNSVHFKADDKLEEYISAKIEKLESVFDGLIGAEVNLKLDNCDDLENKIVDIRLLIKGYDLYAQKNAKTFEEATSLVSEALRRQLRKHKEKMRTV